MYEPLAHEIDIHRHLPPVLEDIEEFIEITKVENENFNRARIDLLALFKMRFVHDADEGGIARWEKMLKIKRRSTDDLELRRIRVLAKLNNKLPYTWRTLKRLLTSFYGEDRFKVFLDPQEYLLDIIIPSNAINYYDLKKTLENMLPMNLYYLLAMNVIDGLIKLIVKTYNFPVPYRICNMFQTDTVPGKLAKGALSLQHRGYTFDAFTPICGTFVTSTINSVQSNLNVELDNEFRDVDVLYRRASDNTITGEGEI